MHPYLNRLGVPKDVQLFFEPHFYTNAQGQLCFKYGDQEEVFAFGTHRIPAAIYFWQAGDVFARQLILATSAMECIAFLALNSNRFPGLALQMVALGLTPDWTMLTELARDRRLGLAFGRDLLGRLWDIKVAASIRAYPAHLTYAGDGQLIINGQTYAEGRLSLSAFERASRFRSGIRTYKPKGFTSYLEQLTA